MSDFILRNIEINLDNRASITNAIREIHDIENMLVPALNALVHQMAERGVEIAKATLLSFSKPAFDTGELYDTLRYEEPAAGEATIHAGYDGDGAPGFYASYVEFGTGIAGGTEADGYYRQSGWVYYNDRIGRFVFTTGMAARPFMYRTYRQLEEEVKSMGGRIIAEYIA